MTPSATSPDSQSFVRELAAGPLGQAEQHVDVAASATIGAMTFTGPATAAR